MLRTIVKSVLLLSLVIIILFPLGCSPKVEYTKIDLANREPVKIAPSLESSEMMLRVAISGVISPMETLKSYNQLLSYLGETLYQPVEMVQRDTYAKINDLVKSRFVDLAFICTLAYVRGKEEFGMELLVVPQVNGETVYYSYLIVPADSDTESLRDLRGKTFAFTDPLSNSGRLVPAYQLHQMGETPDNFFKKYIFTYSHDNSIRAVAEKIVDGAAVDSLVYDYLIRLEPAIADQTRIIHKSPPFGIPPVVVHPALGLEVKARFRGFFLNLNQSRRGKEILNSLMIDQFVLGSDASYDTIRDMAHELRG